ncbi:hypothetical protein HAV15_010638 [Penicillium sp. str. |nr:hypothetical protein HAV15_010638 [Penicillium sp. str. \
MKCQIYLLQQLDPSERLETVLQVLQRSDLVSPKASLCLPRTHKRQSGAYPNQIRFRQLSVTITGYAFPPPEWEEEEEEEEEGKTTNTTSIAKYWVSKRWR